MDIEDGPKGEMVIYKDSQGPEIKVKFENETVWLSQIQMAELFGKDRDTISEHIQNIYKESELSPVSTTRNFRVVRREGKREVTRIVSYYNLDVIISVGYRVKSKRGTQFRVWATQKLHNYFLKGYAINIARIKERQDAKLKELQGTVQLFQQAIATRTSEGYEKELLNIITDYANTWAVLSKYDEGELFVENVTKKKHAELSYEQVKKAVEQFRSRLSLQGEASEDFGNEIGFKLKSLLASIEEAFRDFKLYPSIEERAAHLFYTTIQDRPFVDGNKRIGALLFLLYLVENNYLYNRRGERKLDDNALATLALLIAESKPDQKDIMVKLIVNLINKK